MKDHLRNVYGCLTLGLLTSLIGAFVNYVFDFYSFRFLFTIAIFGFMIALITTPASRDNEKKRLMYFFSFAFLTGKLAHNVKDRYCSGCNLAPFIQAVDAEPALIFNAYMITFITFGCFSLAALFADSTKFLHLGGSFVNFVCYIV